VKCLTCRVVEKRKAGEAGAGLNRRQRRALMFGAKTSESDTQNPRTADAVCETDDRCDTRNLKSRENVTENTPKSLESRKSQDLMSGGNANVACEESIRASAEGSCSVETARGNDACDLVLREGEDVALSRELGKEFSTAGQDMQASDCIDEAGICDRKGKQRTMGRETGPDGLVCGQTGAVGAPWPCETGQNSASVWYVVSEQRDGNQFSSLHEALLVSLCCLLCVCVCVYAEKSFVGTRSKGTAK
jgi:hypothetical protein